MLGGFGVDLNYKGVAEMRGMRGCVDAHTAAYLSRSRLDSFEANCKMQTSGRRTQGQARHGV